MVRPPAWIPTPAAWSSASHCAAVSEPLIVRANVQVPGFGALKSLAASPPVLFELAVGSVNGPPLKSFGGGGVQPAGPALTKLLSDCVPLERLSNPTENHLRPAVLSRFVSCRGTVSGDPDRKSTP